MTEFYQDESIKENQTFKRDMQSNDQNEIPTMTAKTSSKSQKMNIAKNKKGRNILTRTMSIANTRR